MHTNYNTYQEFKKLPEDVQLKIIKDLSAYNETHVFYEYGRYIVSVDWGLKSSYGYDHKFIGEWNYEELSKYIPELVQAREHYEDECSKANWENFL